MRRENNREELGAITAFSGGEEDKEISNKEVIRKVIKQAGQVTFAGILESVNGIATGFILARVSDDALSASSLISVTQAVLIIPAMALLNSVGIKIRQIPQSDPDREIKMGKVWRRGMALATMTGVPISLVFRFGAAPFLSAVGQKTELTDLAQSFFSAYAWGIVPRAWLRCTQQFAFGANQQWLVIGIRAFNLLILAYPTYELAINSNNSVNERVAGLGYAFSIQSTIGSMAFISTLFLLPRFKPHQLYKNLISTSEVKIRDLWNLGWPIGLLASIEFIGSYISTILIGLIGKDELSAQQISLGFAFIIVEFTFGISQSASYLIGQYAGDNKFTTLRKTGIIHHLLSLFFPAAAFIIFMFATKHMAYLYIDINDPKNQNILKIIEILMPIKAFALGCDAIKNVSYGLLSGLSDTLIPSLYSGIGTLIVGIAGSSILGIALKGDIYGIILGQALGMVVNASILSLRWKKTISSKESVQAVMANPPKLNFKPCIKDSQNDNDRKTSCWSRFWKSQNPLPEDRQSLLEAPDSKSFCTIL